MALYAFLVLLKIFFFFSVCLTLRLQRFFSHLNHLDQTVLEKRKTEVEKLPFWPKLV